MNKAILVIDMPISCEKCLLMCEDEYSYWCSAIDRDNKNDLHIEYMLSNTRPVWCPLKPAPQEQEVWFDDTRSDWERGYNNCLCEIIGKDE